MPLVNMGRRPCRAISGALKMPRESASDICSAMNTATNSGAVSSPDQPADQTPPTGTPPAA
ncbi:hypothetical protein [Streptomyces gobitricini]|uniref:Uncharacterized protein n=1 Tax=Streptomyces gobitricini TaxID=68211 RepID=A0ABP5ZG21_9ACTN